MNEYEQLINEIESIVNGTKPHIFIVNEIRDRVEVFKNKKSKFKSIKQIVSDYHQLKDNEISIKSRKREIVEARQIAMYFYDKYTKLSLNSISLEFAYLDHVFHHSTILFAIDTVNNLKDSDKRFKAKIEEIEEEVKRHY